MHEDKATEIMRTVHDYVQTVKASSRTGASSGAGSGIRNLNIALDNNGYPIAPCPASWDKTTKTELEYLYRTYITEHYRTLN
jgi:hypothetical protein